MIVRIYYGLWSEMSEWPMLGRAAVVLGCCGVLLYVLSPLIKGICKLVIRLLDKAVKLFYLFLSAAMEHFLQNLTLPARIETINKVTKRAEHISEWLLKKANRINGKKRFSLRKVIVFYFILLFLIGLPSLLHNIVHPEYMEVFAWAAERYQELEADTLEKAAGYPKLFQAKEEEPSESEEHEETQTMEIWLSLSDKGRQGTNVREGPDKDTKSLTVLQGEDKVLYLGELQDGWVRIQMEDGTIGWIKDYLLEGLE